MKYSQSEATTVRLSSGNSKTKYNFDTYRFPKKLTEFIIIKQS